MSVRIVIEIGPGEVPAGAPAETGVTSMRATLEKTGDVSVMDRDLSQAVMELLKLVGEEVGKACLGARIVVRTREEI